MDEAAVYTIHGFCQRMLTQNASSLAAALINGACDWWKPSKAQVVADYWRVVLYPLPIQLAGEVRNIWGSPAALLADVNRYLTGSIEANRRRDVGGR